MRADRRGVKDLYSIDGIVETKLNTDINAVVCRWETFSGHGHLRPCIETQIQAVRSGARFVVVDVSAAKGLPNNDDQEWFGTHVFPAYEKAKLRALITIVPQSAVTKLGARRWQSTGNRFGFETFEAASLDEAFSICRERAA